MWKKNLLASAVVGLGMALSSGVANAGVIAQSVLDINNFRFLNADGSTISITQFESIIFNDSSLANVNLNGDTDSGALNQASFGTLDLAQQCVGDCVFGENDYSQRPAPSSLNIARADTLLQGAPLANVPGTSDPADAHVVNEAQLTTAAGFGNAESNIGLTATIQFVLGTDQIFGVGFDAVAYLLASVGATDATGSTARASYDWNIELTNSAGDTLFAWTPDNLGGGIIGGTIDTNDNCDINRVVNAQILGVTNSYSCSGSFIAYTDFELIGGELYTLGLRHGGRADVTRLVEVPEPGALSLAALGLIGLAAAARRRKTQA